MIYEIQLKDILICFFDEWLLYDQLKKKIDCFIDNNSSVSQWSFDEYSDA